MKISSRKRIIPIHLNTQAECGNLLNLIWPDRGTNTPIEYMVGTRILFRFCARLEVTCFDDIFGPPAPMIRTVLSHIQGAGIKAGAFDIRGEENPLACGY